MAEIKKEFLTQIEKERNCIHEPVEASYTVFEKNGKKYFQIDTYGSSSRQHKHKISQSIQFDEETADYLVEIIIKELGIKK